LPPSVTPPVGGLHWVGWLPPQVRNPVFSSNVCFGALLQYWTFWYSAISSSVTRNWPSRYHAASTLNCFGL
jgi:hypothetical protein